MKLREFVNEFVLPSVRVKGNESADAVLQCGDVSDAYSPFNNVAVVDAVSAQCRLLKSATPPDSDTRSLARSLVVDLNEALGMGLPIGMIPDP